MTGPNSGPAEDWRDKIDLTRLTEKLAQVKFHHVTTNHHDRETWDQYKRRLPDSARVLYQDPAWREVQQLLNELMQLFYGVRQDVIQTVVETCKAEDRDGYGMASIPMIYAALGLEYSEPLSSDPDDEPTGDRCKAFACGERDNEPRTLARARWWRDFGTCSRSCAVDYYGDEAI